MKNLKNVSNIAQNSTEDGQGGTGIMEIEKLMDVPSHFQLQEGKFRMPEQALSVLLPAGPSMGKSAEAFSHKILAVELERNALAEKILKVLDETGTHYQAIATPKKLRLFFRYNLKIHYFSGKIFCGAHARIVPQITGHPEIPGGMQVLHNDKECDPLPLWMHPTDDISPLNSSTTLISESKWTRYMSSLYHAMRSQDTGQNKKAHKAVLEAAAILNEHFRQHSFDQKRMEGFLDIMDLEFCLKDYYEKIETEGHTITRFRKDAFCEFFIKRYRIINLEFLPFRYSNGTYLPITPEEVDSLLLKYLADISPAMRKDIRNMVFSLVGANAQRTASKSDVYFEVRHPAKPELIAFENGIFDVSTGKMEEFNENIIITNRIPYELKFDYYHKLTEEGRQTEEMKAINDWLDSFSEHNTQKKLVLEEVAGLVLYRRNAGLRRQHTILVGSKESGKSTFIRMLENLLGDSTNCSHVSLEEICNTNNRFSLVSMVGTSANTYADISHRTILDASRLKNICTSDPITVEQKNQPVMTMSYKGKLILGCNQLPRIEDRAISSRFEIIPCNADFSSTGTANIPNLYEDCISKKECMEYFAYLAVTALQRFIRNGLKHTYCAENEEIRRNYEKIADPVLSFVNAMPEDEIVNQDTSDVFENYTTYLVKTLKLPDREVENITKNSLTTALKRLGYNTKRKSVGGNKITIYIKCT